MDGPTCEFNTDQSISVVVTLGAQSSLSVSDEIVLNTANLIYDDCASGTLSNSYALITGFNYELSDLKASMRQSVSN